MANWSVKNDLILNSKKTVIINLKKKNVQLESVSPLIYLEGKSLKVVDETKFLGVTIDCHLSWVGHINNVAQHIASGCYLIKRILRICNFNTAKLVYFSYVHSRLLYGIVLWDNSPRISKLFVLQKRAVKYLAKASYDPLNQESIIKIHVGHCLENTPFCL
jgi:hypothetical protein